eukprot:s963_g2.t1
MDARPFFSSVELTCPMLFRESCHSFFNSRSHRKSTSSLRIVCIVPLLLRHLCKQSDVFRWSACCGPHHTGAVEDSQYSTATLGRDSDSSARVNRPLHRSPGRVRAAHVKDEERLPERRWVGSRSHCKSSSLRASRHRHGSTTLSMCLAYFQCHSPDWLRGPTLYRRRWQHCLVILFREWIC